MEYEKTYLPMIIIKKKNYIGVKYEMNPEEWKVDYKGKNTLKKCAKKSVDKLIIFIDLRVSKINLIGIAIKRRNYCPFVKDVYWSVIYPALGINSDKKTKVINIFIFKNL